MNIQLDKVTTEMLLVVMKKNKHYDAKKFLAEQISNMYFSMQRGK